MKKETVKVVRCKDCLYWDRFEYEEIDIQVYEEE